MFDVVVFDGSGETLLKYDNGILKGCTLKNKVCFDISEDVKMAIKSLKLSDDFTDLGIIDGYSVKLDNHSGFKHYFKDGQEDVKMFLTNGVPEFNAMNGNKSLDSKMHKFLLHCDKIVTIASSVLVIILVTGSIVYENLKFDLAEKMTNETIAEFIAENDNLSQDEKEYFFNEAFINDVLFYSQDTNMDYYLNLRLDGITFSYYDPDPEDPKSINSKTYGQYYAYKYPNILFIRNGLDNDISTKVHEYIHMFQSPLVKSKYYYIDESSVPIIEEEYFHEIDGDAYYMGSRNLKILMEIVGPEVIWKLIFADDDTDLQKILDQYLTKEDKERFMYIINLPPTYDIREEHLELTDLLEKLYMNMYGKYMFFDPIIANLYWRSLSNRYYFNKELIDNSECYYDGYLCFYLNAEKEIDYDEYIEYSEKMKSGKDDKAYFRLSTKYHINSDETINIENDEVISEKEAYDRGILKFYLCYDFLDIDSDKYYKLLDDGFDLEPLYGGESIEENIEFKEVFIPSILEKFPDQSIGIHKETKKR